MTDDTQMALALGRALIQSEGCNAVAVADSYVDWLKSKPVDVGNSAAMRNLPLVLLTLNNEQNFIDHTLAQTASPITIRYPMPQPLRWVTCCGQYLAAEK